MKSKTRDSRIELLRIVAMMLIVMSHFSLSSAKYWNLVEEGRMGQAFEAVKIMYFDVLGQPGAIVFFIISGFFFYSSSNWENQKRKAFRQVWKTWSKTFFYSLIMLIICWIYIKKPTLKQIGTAILPFSFNEYWFITCYITVYLFAPILNKLIDTMLNKEFRFILSMLFLLMFPALLNGGILNNLLLAFGGYLVGAYMKRYKEEINSIKTKNIIVVALIDYFVMLVSVFCSKYIGISTYHSAHFTHYPLSFILAICIFILFLRMPPFKSKIVNKLASGTFAVYLITVYPLFADYLLKEIIHISSYQDLGWLIFFINIGTSFAVYIICSSIDIIIFGILDKAKAKLKLDKINNIFK